MSEPPIVGNFLCECPHPIIGARVSGTPLRCERCRGLVRQSGLSQQWRYQAGEDTCDPILDTDRDAKRSCADELDAAKLRIEAAVKVLLEDSNVPANNTYYSRFRDGQRVTCEAVLKIIREVL